MTISPMTRAFGAAALAALSVLPLAGCGNGPSYVTPSEPATTQTTPVNVTFRQVANGIMMHNLPDGTHIVTYPGAAIGTPNDLNCLVVKEKFEDSFTAVEDSTAGIAYSGVSCDWAGARAPRL